MVNFQSIEFRVAPNARLGTGSRSWRRRRPSTSRSTIASDSRRALAARPARPGRFRGRLRAVGSRRIQPARCPRNARSAASPACCSGLRDYAFGTFVELWRELGGEFNGALRIEAAPPDAQLIREFRLPEPGGDRPPDQQVQQQFDGAASVAHPGRRALRTRRRPRRRAPTPSRVGPRARARSAGHGHRQRLGPVARHAHLGCCNGLESPQCGLSQPLTRRSSSLRCRSPASTAP